MAKAIQCDVCRQVVPQRNAQGWRMLTLNARPILTGDGFGEEFDPHADLCSAKCAAEWFEQLARRCFRQQEEEFEELLERHV